MDPRDHAGLSGTATSPSGLETSSASLSQAFTLTRTSSSSDLTADSNVQKSLFIPVLDHGSVPCAPISGSDDLLSLFNLVPVYDRFVKPYLKPLDQSTNPSASNPSGLGNSDIKGKGKADATLSLGGVPSDNMGHKRMKMEKSYGHFVADVGGRNSIKKDHQLQTWIMDPNFQEAAIPNFMKPFPAETLAQAFTLQAGTLPGFDSSVWIAEEGGPKRKAKKKRKQGDLVAGNEAAPPAPSNGKADHQVSHAANSLPPTLSNRGESLNGSGLSHVTHQQPSPHTIIMKEEEHRKKKRTKLTPSNHQIALQL